MNTTTFETFDGRRHARKQNYALDRLIPGVDFMEEQLKDLEWEIERMRFELWLISKELPPGDP